MNKIFFYGHKEHFSFNNVHKETQAEFNSVKRIFINFLNVIHNMFGS